MTKRTIKRKVPVARAPNPLLADTLEFIRRYVVLADNQLLIVGIWAIHTHCFYQFEQTPYLSVTSPEKQCGKSRLLEVLQKLVKNPWMTIGPSEAVVFRKVHAERPTMLLDEVDTIFNNLKNSDQHEGLRQMLNSGHRNGSKVSRCLAGGERLVDFRVYCPKVLAGIGTLPDTVADRSVPVRLARRTRAEYVERFFNRDVDPIAETLRDRIEAWTDKHGEALGLARPELPPELSDRMQEGCEPLLAIADALGVGVEARTALVELLGGERLDSVETTRLRLLRDIKTVFETRGMPSAVFTEYLLDGLHAMEEAQWGGRRYYGRELDERDLAGLLHHYDVKSTTVRIKGKPDAKPKKGYRQRDLVAVWERYV